MRFANGTLPAATTDGSYYTAMVDTDTLESLGEYVGTIELLIDGESFDRIRVIFNIEETEADPYLVDDFESYYGVDSLLTSAWATNKASGSTISLTLTDADGEAQEGYGLNFTYSETSGGWAGALPLAKKWTGRTATPSSSGPSPMPTSRRWSSKFRPTTPAMRRI